MPFLPRLKRFCKKKTKNRIKSILKNPGKNTTPTKNRSLSVPKHRGQSPPPALVVSKKIKEKKRNDTGRSTSTPRHRGHFGTEAVRASDVHNSATFGDSSDDAFSPEDMFRVNEQLTGRQFLYDGNAREFGNVTSMKKLEKTTTRLAPSVAALFNAHDRMNEASTTPLRSIVPTIPPPVTELEDNDSNIVLFEFDMDDILTCL